MKLRILSCLFVLCVLGTPLFAHASVLGISGGKIELESLPNEMHEKSFILSRTNPTKDENITIAVSGNASEFLSLRDGEQFLFKKGEETKTIPFTIHTRGTHAGEVYTSTVQFLLDTTEEVAEGNAIRLGIAGSIKMQIVAQLSSRSAPIDAQNIKKIPSGITLSELGVEVTSKDELKVIHFSLMNKTESAYQNIPYTLEVMKGGKVFFTKNDVLTRSIESQQETRVVHNLKLSGVGSYKIILRVGDQVRETVYKFQLPLYGLGEYVFQPWLVLGLIGIFCAPVLLLVRKKGRKTIFISIFLCGILGALVWGALLYAAAEKWKVVPLENVPSRANFILGQKSGGEKNLLTNLFLGKTQELDGEWNFFSLSESDVLVFPVEREEKEKVRDQFYYLKGANIYAAPVEKLPGLITWAEQDRQGAFLLMGGIEANKRPFTCIAEAVGSSMLQCLRLNDLVGVDTILKAAFSENPHEVIYRTKEGVFRVDLWTQEIQKAGNEMNESSTQNAAAIRAEGMRALDVFVPWKKIGGKWFFVGTGKYIQELERDAYLEIDQTKNGKVISILQPSKKARSVLYEIETDDKIYFLKKGISITVP